MNIRPVTLSESAEAAARIAVETHTTQPNPHPLGCGVPANNKDE